VKVDVQLSNHNVDFTAEGFDLAIRGRTPPDSGLVARRLMDAPLVAVAAPSYLARTGTPQTLEDLAQHECIQFELPSSGQRVTWSFRRDGEDVDVPTGGGLCCLSDLLATVTLARAGGGLLNTYRFLVEEDLQRGTLVEVLQPYAGRSRPFSLLYPQNRHMPLRVRVFIDYLTQAMA
jgi:DNA-binding transcriptional LysR family regulator